MNRLWAWLFGGAKAPIHEVRRVAFITYDETRFIFEGDGLLVIISPASGFCRWEATHEMLPCYGYGMTKDGAATEFAGSFGKTWDFLHAVEEDDLLPHELQTRRAMVDLISRVASAEEATPC